MAFVAERINSIRSCFERVREEIGEEMEGVAQRGLGAHSLVRATAVWKVGRLSFVSTYLLAAPRCTSSAASFLSGAALASSDRARRPCPYRHSYVRRDGLIG